MKRKSIKNDAGFTLIELLVVISIIGMLSTIVLVSLNSARGKARDARRMGDLHSLRTALELYYDANGKYPVIIVGGSCILHTNVYYADECLSALVTSGFISSLPTGPSASEHYYYDNFCNIPGPSSNDQQFRLWTNGGESNLNGIAKGWWANTDIGETTCQDPS